MLKAKSMLESIKRLADDYEIKDSKILYYYRELVKELESRTEIIVDEEDDRIVSCLERIVSERTSIKNNSVSSKSYTVKQTILRAISTEFGLGLQTDEFATDDDFEKIAHKVAYENDQTFDEYLEESTKKIELQQRQGNIRLL